jgi:hypothetical protein
MTTLTRPSVQHFQNHFDVEEIVQELQAQANRNREINQGSFKKVCQVYFDEIIQELQSLADKNRRK